MKILITGARSFVAYSLIRLAKLQNCEIYIADSQKKNICFTSKIAMKKFIFPSPKNDFLNFKKEIIDFCKKEKIQKIFPTCEEVFYFSKIKTDLQEIGTDVFCDDFDKLLLLHSKNDFIKFCEDLPIKTPKTTKITEIEELEWYKNVSEKMIFKYEFSRFANYVFVNFDDKNFKNIKKLQKLEGNMVAQEFINWEKYCSFWVAKDGKLCSNIIYDVKFSYKWGSATFFWNIFNEKIHYFVEKIVEKLNFTGFISFDYIVTENEIFVIECNPRVTSGIHLFDNNNILAKLIFANFSEKFFPKDNIYKTFILPNLCFNFLKSWKDKKALSWKNEVLSQEINIFFYQIYLLIYYAFLSKKSWKTLSEITTWDIEFNA